MALGNSEPTRTMDHSAEPRGLLFDRSFTRFEELLRPNTSARFSDPKDMLSELSFWANKSKNVMRMLANLDTGRAGSFLC